MFFYFPRDKNKKTLGVFFNKCQPIASPRFYINFLPIPLRHCLPHPPTTSRSDWILL